MRLVPRCAVVLLFLCAFPPASRAQQPGDKAKSKPDDIPALIDKLQEIGEGDVGYMPTQTGSGFLPLGVSDAGALLLGQGPPAQSETMRELVSRGSAAVRHLIAHLDDNRPTKITIGDGSDFGGMFFEDEYDYNRRTVKKPPEGVNRDLLGGDRKHPNKHVVSVGDLCFVALGQIVNRHFNAVRYQPTACIMINSPTYSETLRKAIKAEWEGLTSEGHKNSLVRDFREPDSEYRRNGACLRLGYYYRGALEPLVLEQLGKQRYDSTAGYDLIHERLYRAKDARQRREPFDAFIAKAGDVGREGVLADLFEDLDQQEADEEGRLHPPLKEKYNARACLIELYGYPKEVKSDDAPAIEPTTDIVQARFIETLALFPTPKIDAAVRKVLHATEDDDLAQACVKYLVGRDADADIRQYVEKRLPGAPEERREELNRLLERLGWTPLHVAAEAGEEERLADLIRKGANINARAANGQTPLHVAAENGEYGAIRFLLDRKADLNAKDKQGQTPAALAIGYESAVEMFLEAGAEPSDILVAAYAGRADLVHGFLDKDKSLAGAKSLGGETPLHFAAQHGHVRVAEELLAVGADVNALTGSKFTPLHYAAMNGKDEVVALLLAHKADRSAKSWESREPLSYARERGHKETIRLLEKGE